MTITLPPELERAVKERVESGLYGDASEALRQSFKQASDNEWLKREATLGFLQLEAGETREVSNRETFFAIARGEQ